MAPTLELDITDPPLTLRLGNRSFTIPWWKLYYDLCAIDEANKGNPQALMEEYRKYLVIISGANDGDVGIGDANAFHNKYWLAYVEKKSLADAQPPSSTPSSAPSMASLSPTFPIQ